MIRCEAQVERGIWNHRTHKRQKKIHLALKPEPFYTYRPLDKQLTKGIRYEIHEHAVDAGCGDRTIFGLRNKTIGTPTRPDESHRGSLESANLRAQAHISSTVDSDDRFRWRPEDRQYRTPWVPLLGKSPWGDGNTQQIREHSSIAAHV